MKTDATFFEATEWIRSKPGRQASRKDTGIGITIYMKMFSHYLTFERENSAPCNQEVTTHDLDASWTLHPAPAEYKDLTWQEAVQEVNKGNSKVECLFKDWRDWITYTRHTLTLYELPETRWRIKIEDGEDD